MKKVIIEVLSISTCFYRICSRVLLINDDGDTADGDGDGDDQDGSDAADVGGEARSDQAQEADVVDQVDEAEVQGGTDAGNEAVAEAFDSGSPTLLSNPRAPINIKRRRYYPPNIKRILYAMCLERSAPGVGRPGARMSNVTVCVRFRPLSHKERKDEREEDVIFSFDKVFYEDAQQSDVYDFLAVPIVSDAINGINGTIITYGQTGAGKTYSMEGPSILHCNEQKTGLVQRVVDELFVCLRSSASTWTVKLSMVEIYLEKVRDLLDLSKDNLQIKESKTQGIYISGATEISIVNSSDALENLSQGIANRAAGETRTLHLLIWSPETVILKHLDLIGVKAGKIILVDLAGSEKVEKTGAEGRVLDEAKTINKSLSALGNVINALTTGKQNHVPFRDSKLTRILQDALGGNSRAALLCCCSPCPSNAPESLSTLRFGTRTKLIKASPKSIPEVVDNAKKPILGTHDQDDLLDRILSKLRLSLKEEDVDLLEELFLQEGIIFDPNSITDIDSACQDTASEEISLMMQSVEEVKGTVTELTDENEKLRRELEAAQEIAAFCRCWSSSPEPYPA
ncbi:kinesin-1-like protein PSS1 isoform X2 [Panicum miliaceum]|uniref:Kinesin-like protein n=1 Tax=Panicum miliaceum TaxID=4540 RepID=A0A3L6RLW9_PANMI|nr:kinesin-1-like protein PSS1 isoform X2 [Panicum miliaceum]